MSRDLSSIKMEALSRLVSHGMIKLYLDMAYSVRKLDLKQRNHSVIRFLKTAIKKRDYKPVKSSIRELIHYGKEPQANMEEKLREVEQVIILTKATSDKDSDLCAFMGILTKLEKVSPVTVGPFDPDNCRPDHLYLEEGFLVRHFDDKGMLTGMIPMIVPNILMEIIGKVLVPAGWKFQSAHCTDSATYHGSNHQGGHMSLSIHHHPLQKRVSRPEHLRNTFS